MNTKLLLIAISVAAFSSCTTIYKSGQTPDDVYFSPVRLTGVDKQEEKEEQRSEVQTYSRYNAEERYIRMGIYDPRYRDLYNDYSYHPYKYGFNYGYYYNPYYWPYPVYSSVYNTPSNPKNTTPRIANLGAYNNGNIKTYSNPKTGSTRGVKYNNSNNGSAVGNVIRQLFVPGETGNSTNNPSSNNSNNNSRTYSPSSSSSSSSSGSSSSGGGGGISRPSRGGGN